MREKVIVTEIPRERQEKYSVKELFKSPIFHRQIHGDQIYIPLDKEKLWGI